jgi:hypothetical protein
MLYCKHLIDPVYPTFLFAYTHMCNASGDYFVIVRADIRPGGGVRRAGGGTVAAAETPLEFAQDRSPPLLRPRHRQGMSIFADAAFRYWESIVLRT